MIPNLNELFPECIEYAPASGVEDAAGQEESAHEPLKSAPTTGGVYLLTDEADRLVQLASAGNLRRAMQARLLKPEPDDRGELTPAQRKRAKLGRVVRRIRWRQAYSLFEITLHYLHIARRLQPREYLKSLGFSASWVVHIDPADAFPRFLPKKALRGTRGVYLGPFTSHSQATRFIQILEDAFDLCRYHHILELAPDGHACAYYEMGKCPAPCDGSISMPQYGRMLAEALRFAKGDHAFVFDRLDASMRAAAEGLEFERAATLKQQLERARSIDDAAFRFVRPVDEFNYLIVQRDRGRTRVRPFYVRSGRIEAGAAVKLKELESATPDWVKRLGETTLPIEADELQAVTEQIWLVAYFLFKRDPQGVFLHESELGTAESLAERVRVRFAPGKNSDEEATGAMAGEESAESVDDD